MEDTDEKASVIARWSADHGCGLRYAVPTRNADEVVRDSRGGGGGFVGGPRPRGFAWRPRDSVAPALSAAPEFVALPLSAAPAFGAAGVGSVVPAGGERRRFVGAGFVGAGLVGAGYYGGYGYGGGCRRWQVVGTPWGPQWRLVNVCFAPVGYGYGPVGFYGAGVW